MYHLLLSRTQENACEQEPSHFCFFNTSLRGCHSVLDSFCKLSNYVGTRKQCSTR
jgi:hypothetical protein